MKRLHTTLVAVIGASAILGLAVLSGCSTGGTGPSGPGAPAVEPSGVAKKAESGTETTTEEKAAMTEKKLDDGTYKGKSFKFPGKFIASVTVKDGKITGITVEKHFALRKYTRILDDLIARMIHAQSAEVDVVTGATISSNAMKKAVRHALGQASGEIEVPSPPPREGR